MRTGTAIIAILFMSACGPQAPPPAPSVTDAWIRETPPGSAMTAGYLTLNNPAGRAIDIVGVESDDFGSIELHTTVTEDGVAKMRREESVTVPPESKVVFEPGGRHLMMFDPARPLPAGETVSLTIILSDGSRVHGEAAVTRDGSGRHQH